jgi:hypothetical protein
MKYTRYPLITSDDLFMYEFYSEGSRGTIKKTVIYSQIEGNLFNLGFGDWNEELKGLDDSSRSNNGDRDKVLATVAFTAIDFTNKFPGVQIFAEGSTIARTRLYQMGIGDNLVEISAIFKVDGFFEAYWEPFQKGRNYEALLIKRK